MSLKRLKQEELMISNYVYFYENNEQLSIGQVIGIGDFGGVDYVNVNGINICEFDYTERILDSWDRDLFAIPLEDVLLRISEESKTIMLKNNIDIKFVVREKVGNYSVFFNDINLSISYIHELQNIVKTLSGFDVVLNGL